MKIKYLNLFFGLSLLFVSCGNNPKGDVSEEEKSPIDSNENQIETPQNSLDVSNEDNMIIQGKTFIGVKNKSFKSIIIPNTVNRIGRYALANCNLLKSVEIPSSVQVIEEYAFSDCTSLTSIIIPNGVKEIGHYAFRNCTLLNSFYLSESVEILGASIDNSSSRYSSAPLIFDNCFSLEIIKVDKNNRLFDSRDNCNAIIFTERNVLLVGCKNTFIPNSVKELGYYAFSKCKIESIEIPSSVTSICNFTDCISLKYVKLNLEASFSIYFRGCCALKEVFINFLDLKASSTRCWNVAKYIFDNLRYETVGSFVSVKFANNEELHPDYFNSPYEIYELLYFGSVTPSVNNAEIAVVTDLGSLMDGSFNQGTWEGAKEYADANKKTIQYYQPPNTSDATDADRAFAMNTAIKNGAKIVIAPGFAQANALTEVAKANPEVKFVFIDGFTLGQDNITAISYNEHEAAYMAGYAAVKEGYTKLGGTFAGGGINLACNRYAYGYVQGINAAAEGVSGVEVKISFKYGDSYSASPELQTQMSSWYNGGTEVIFGCGGTMLNSVKAAAEAVTETDSKKAKIIGFDVDQYSLSSRVITSATKGLKASVKKVLGQFYNNEWDSVLECKLQQLGAKDDATGIAYHEDRLKKFTKADYDALLKSIKEDKVTIKSDATQFNSINNTDFWNGVNNELKNVSISLDK